VAQGMARQGRRSGAPDSLRAGLADPPEDCGRKSLCCRRRDYTRFKIAQSAILARDFYRAMQYNA